MKTQSVGILLEKVNELKALFIFGQRVIPFLEELFYFVQEVVPLLDEINISIRESSGKIPRASTQLNKVTEATEMATTEILNTVDSIVFKLGGIKANIENMKALSDKQRKIVPRITRYLETLSQRYQGDEIVSALIRSWEEFQKHLCKSTMFKATKDSVENIRRASTDIMVALQVQDITAQQIAAVNHLIESVQFHLQTLLGKFHEADLQELVTEYRGPVSRKMAFDAEADYLKGRERQQAADSIIGQTQPNEKLVSDNNGQEFNLFSDRTSKESYTQEGQCGGEITSQAEIDQLFNKKE